MRLTVLRGNVDAVMFHVHAEGCADVTKRKYARAEREDGEWSSLQALTEDYYCHQIEESGSTWEDSDIPDFVNAQVGDPIPEEWDVQPLRSGDA